MKIARRRQSSLDNGIAVAGESGVLSKRLADHGMALSCAQSLALRREEPCLYFVTEWGQRLYEVERDTLGVVTTRAAVT